MPKEAIIYECKDCSFICSKKSNYESHIATNKHKREIMEKYKKIMETQKMPLMICIHCDNKYSSKSGLWKHIKKHHTENEQPTVVIEKKTVQ